MPKFRSMVVRTPVVATHLLQNAETYLSPVGAFIRKTSLDELPQLWCIFTGEMSFVGPRPALFNQIDLIELRKKAKVDDLLPGITGWAQVNGRDELSVFEKVQFDSEYRMKRSFKFDLKILYLTVLNVLRRDGISH
jgi:O-antigen biosynthesis protein WbqP